MPDSQIKDIHSRAMQDVRKLLEEAFEAGRADMRREMLALLSDNSRQTFYRPTVTLTGSDADLEVGRAPSGTVKPAIKELIEKAPNGILASDIIEKTGFKENSVRGTLSALKAEGFAERRGELWFPLALASGP
jgi:hypothetical protein